MLELKVGCIVENCTTGNRAKVVAMTGPSISKKIIFLHIVPLEKSPTIDCESKGVIIYAEPTHNGLYLSKKNKMPLFKVVE